MQSLSIGATGMLAQEMNVQVIANNIANVGTTGFKRQRADFQDLLYQYQARTGEVSSPEGARMPSGVQIGAGVELDQVSRVNEQGTMQQTGNPLDVALDGPGYLQIEMPDGSTAYTRAGQLQLSPEGEIVTADGFRLIGPGPVPTDAQEVGINAEGRVYASLAGETEPTELGQIELALFANPGGLEALGDNLLRETVASGGPQVGVPGRDGFADLRQGMLEGSNVNIISEITQLIAAQRAYEMNAKVVTISDEMLRSSSNLR
jgi:flagellar basal-body rod protein FlgG